MFMSGEISFCKPYNRYPMYCSQGLRVHRLDQRNHPTAQLNYKSILIIVSRSNINQILIIEEQFTITCTSGLYNA